MAGGYFRISNDNTRTDENGNTIFKSPIFKIEFMVTNSGVESFDSFPKAVLLDSDFPLNSLNGTALFNGKKARTVAPVFLDCAGLDINGDKMLHYTGHTAVYAAPFYVGTDAEIDLAIGNNDFVMGSGKNIIYMKDVGVSGTTGGGDNNNN